MKMKFDENIYYPLGGASYVFKDNLIKYIKSKIDKRKIKISVGSQPNSSPHFGTISVFSLAFSLAEQIKKNYEDLDISILFEVVDTAPSEKIEINGITYQKSLKSAGIIEKYIPQFTEILQFYSKKTGISYEIRYQHEFNNLKEVKSTIREVVSNREKIAKFIDQKYERLRVRVACPRCGLSDKNSINNEYSKDNRKLISYCPEHGRFETDIETQSYRLEYNTPLRNLIRAIVYGTINNSDEYDYQIIRITGNDYAGFYQEELLYKIVSLLGYPVHNLPLIIYCPLIMDWSGAKLSKTLYVKSGAYKYLPEYLINYENLIKSKGKYGLEIINKITKEWVLEPYKLFRNYSIYYFMKRFEDDEKNEK